LVVHYSCYLKNNSFHQSTSSETTKTETFKQAFLLIQGRAATVQRPENKRTLPKVPMIRPKVPMISPKWSKATFLLRMKEHVKNL
jgi:hypothetical protein